MAETGRTRRKYAGFVPFAAIGIGAGAGGWIASLAGLPEWILAVPGMVGGYFASGAILERIYARTAPEGKP